MWYISGRHGEEESPQRFDRQICAITRKLIISVLTSDTPFERGVQSIQKRRKDVLRMWLLCKKI